MKWRNQLLALCCLVLFLGFGVFYFRYWVIQKPFGIILFIGEGLDARTLAAARLHGGGADKLLALDSLPYTAFLRNYSADSSVPDVAAAATAIATGTKVRNGAIALDEEGQSLQALLALAHDAGRATGLITDGDLTAPTVAAFYGHAQSSADGEKLAQQLIEEAQIDVILGRGSAVFWPETMGGGRTDETDLLHAAREDGYTLARSLNELDAVPRWPRARLLGFFDYRGRATPDAAPRAAVSQPTLLDLVRRGIELLQFHPGGYLLIIDVSAMRTARGARTPEQRLSAAQEFDQAIAVALQYTGEKSAIFVCGDVADAIAVSSTDEGQPPKAEEIAAILPDASDEESTPTLTPATTDAPFALVLAPDSSHRPISMAVDPLPQPFRPPTREEIAEDVLAFGYGLGAETLRGTLDNTELFEIIRDNL